jgi:hypothetical protein
VERGNLKGPLRYLLLALLAVLAAGCGEATGEDGSSEISTDNTGSFEEGTLSLTTGSRERTSPPEGTLREGTDGTGNAVLRLEGDPRTTFSGVCTVGGGEQVLTGRVPKEFAFDLEEGSSLECRIEKRDAGRGSLNAVLTVDDNTRSVQQIDREGGIIELSYSASERSAS